MQLLPGKQASTLGFQPEVRIMIKRSSPTAGDHAVTASTASVLGCTPLVGSWHLSKAEENPRCLLRLHSWTAWSLSLGQFFTDLCLLQEDID
jgi:hypothetical protein